MNHPLNEESLDTLCAALADVMGVAAPVCAAPACPKLTDYAARCLAGRKVDRVFLYHPDAVAQWICEKYPAFLAEVMARTGLALPFRTVMPSVTPVCFGTMYTGAQPAVHGIQRYEKPVIRIDTLFDALIRAGKKPAIVADNRCSMSKIYLDRPMNYYFFDTVEEVNACAAELILADAYDFIVVYNGNYDAAMHKNGPESPRSLAELRANAHAFAQFSALIQRCWRKHDTLIGFATDHGCHEIDENCGAHGLDMPEDLNICHFYGIYPSFN